jgi:hypothetical protein
VSSPDRIPPNETQAERERRVFRFFAADAVAYGLNIRVDSIVSREPREPDILCEEMARGPLAFELAEILDQASMKVMATMMRAREVLQAFPSTLSAPELRRFQSKFAAKQIKVGFKQDRLLRGLESVIPNLYEWLIHTLPDDAYGYAVPLPLELQAEIEYVSILFPGPPFIDVAFGVSIADATIAAVSRKVTVKEYLSIAPIELLVYAHDQPLIQYETWRSTVAAAVIPLMDESIARGHIRRVWIYDISRRKTDQAIKFVYPTPQL